MTAICPKAKNCKEEECIHRTEHEYDYSCSWFGCPVVGDIQCVSIGCLFIENEDEN